MCRKDSVLAVAALAFGAGILAALFLPKGFLIALEAVLILAAGFLFFKR